MDRIQEWGEGTAYTTNFGATWCLQLSPSLAQLLATLYDGLDLRSLKHGVSQNPWRKLLAMTPCKTNFSWKQAFSSRSGNFQFPWIWLLSHDHCIKWYWGKNNLVLTLWSWSNLLVTFSLRPVDKIFYFSFLQVLISNFLSHRYAGNITAQFLLHKMNRLPTIWPGK